MLIMCSVIYGNEVIFHPRIPFLSAGHEADCDYRLTVWPRETSRRQNSSCDGPMILCGSRGFSSGNTTQTLTLIDYIFRFVFLKKKSFSRLLSASQRWTDLSEHLRTRQPGRRHISEGEKTTKLL